ncbi:MAG: hypothetical protein LBK98_08870 [Peptococcaceae bacterium]|jgi:hypothetical protein|nr:hypothetical protein [Peptococcaceae bacterium]
MEDKGKDECVLGGYVSQFHKAPAMYKDTVGFVREKPADIESYGKIIDEWEYCFCAKCGQIRFSSELEATSDGIRCLRCESYDLESPGWVACPNHKDSIVKCPRAGRGIVKTRYGVICNDHCAFRLAEG